MQEIIEHIDALLNEEFSKLEIIESLMSEFSSDYPDYDYTKWREIVSNYLSSKSQYDNACTTKENLSMDLYIDSTINQNQGDDTPKKKIKRKGDDYYTLPSYLPNGISPSYRLFRERLGKSTLKIHQYLYEFIPKKLSPVEFKLVCIFINDKYKERPVDNYYPEKIFLQYYDKYIPEYYKDHIKVQELTKEDKKRLAAARNFIMERKILKQK